MADPTNRPEAMWAIGWEPMPEKRPRLGKCPTCKTVPLWRHSLTCYWIVCPKCGLETAAFTDVKDAAYIWNLSCAAQEKVNGRTKTAYEQSDMELVEQIMEDERNE